MAEYLIQDTTLDAIADAINAKTGGSSAMTPTEMVTAIGSISGKETLSWHQCPEAVRNYLEYVAEHPYSASDNSTTYILDFATDPAVVSNTKPAAYIIDGVTFRDNEPLAATPFATANKAGTLTALDKLRWFNTTCANAPGGSTYPVGYNCRDLGGWACDGGTVKYGLLVRSGEINPVDKDLMANKIGIKTEISLLPLDQQKATDSVWGIDYTANPSNDDIQYRLNYTAQWKLYLQTIFASVAHSKPVLFHCGAGADKTGTLAVVLLGLLGCSLSDIDTDYELTTFAFYSTWRNRTYVEYQNLLNAIKAVPLANGLTDNFQNRCASFALSLGITADEINAFRSACIDGAPTPIEPALEVYTVTKSLSHATIDNAATEAEENSAYSANVNPATGYVLSAVSVTMGGTDVTSQVFSGASTVRRFSVTKALSYCTVDSAAKAVEEGASFVAHLTADTDYTIDSVTITMGGTDVSNYYSNGTITIPSVTGDIVITATAVPSAPLYTNLADPSSADWAADSRLGSDGTPRSGAAGAACTNYVAVTQNDVIRVKGFGDLKTYSTAVYNASKTVLSAALANNQTQYFSYNYDSATGIVTMTITNANVKWIRFSSTLTGAASDVIITKNEAIE